MPYNYLQTLRDSIRTVRGNLTASYQEKSSKQIVQKIKQLHEFRYGKNIALYFAVKGEINVNELWRTAPLQGKYCAFPLLTDEQHLLFLPATPVTSFVNNKYGIPEPQVSTEKAVAPETFDIIFMPLVAFDSACHRLGMGGGYYDRTLAKCRAKTLIGLAYDFQKVPQIAPNSWDVPLDMVITPSTMYRRERTGLRL